MGIIVSFVLIICGGFACYQQIVAKKPEAAEILDKIAPYKKYIGAFALLWGLVSLLDAVSMISHIGLWWVVYVLSALCCIALGFLLSYDLLQQYVLKGNADAEQKSIELKNKVMEKQIMIGYCAIGLGVVGLVLVVIM